MLNARICMISMRSAIIIGYYLEMHKFQKKKLN